jgi:hypothetical protein
LWSVNNSVPSIDCASNFEISYQPD